MSLFVFGISIDQTPIFFNRVLVKGAKRHPVRLGNITGRKAMAQLAIVGDLFKSNLEYSDNIVPGLLLTGDVSLFKKGVNNGRVIVNPEPPAP